jgi:hypothetical protein
MPALCTSSNNLARLRHLVDQRPQGSDKVPRNWWFDFRSDSKIQISVKARFRCFTGPSVSPVQDSVGFWAYAQHRSHRRLTLYPFLWLHINIVSSAPLTVRFFYQVWLSVHDCEIEKGLPARGITAFFGWITGGSHVGCMIMHGTGIFYILPMSANVLDLVDHRDACAC